MVVVVLVVFDFGFVVGLILKLLWGVVDVLVDVVVVFSVVDEV